MSKTEQAIEDNTPDPAAAIFNDETKPDNLSNQENQEENYFSHDEEGCSDESVEVEKFPHEPIPKQTSMPVPLRITPLTEEKPSNYDEEIEVLSSLSVSTVKSNYFLATTNKEVL